MSNGAEVKGKRLCSHAICSCKLGNRIAKRSMGMDAEGTKKSFSCKVKHLEHQLPLYLKEYCSRCLRSQGEMKDRVLLTSVWILLNLEVSGAERKFTSFLPWNSSV